ncbi:hypothetical protein, partial [Asaia sp. As-1742]|uniref:hypothetical protein n=1 Tax=Asaia sp. As-1742 TaxID=2608325 RepID=UPI001962DE7E
TMLYRSTDCRCRRGAPVVNLAHSASFHSDEKIAPSKPGTKHLGHHDSIRLAQTHQSQSCEITQLIFSQTFRKRAFAIRHQFEIFVYQSRKT